MDISRIFFAVFIAAGIAHIGAILLGRERLRRISKVVLVPLLLAVYLCGPDGLPLLPVFALILGWAGDVLLIRIDKKRNFMLGLASFLLGHIFYIVTFIHLLGFSAGTAVRLDLSVLALNALPGIGLGIVVFRLVNPPGNLYLPVILYMVVLEALAFFGFQVFLFNPGFSGLLIVSGCLCFMISDTILAYYTFRKPKIFGSFFIMLYYLAAQAEIILGIMSIASPGGR